MNNDNEFILGFPQDKRVYHYPASSRADDGGLLAYGVGPEQLCYCDVIRR